MEIICMINTFHLNDFYKLNYTNDSNGCYISLSYNNNIIAAIYYYFDKEEYILNIIDLKVDESHRRSSIATFLILLSLQIVAVDNNSKNIDVTLDDMSEQARTNNSIYVNSGFHYETRNPSKSPEMKSGLIHIYRTIKNKLIKKNNWFIKIFKINPINLFNIKLSGGVNKKVKI